MAEPEGGFILSRSIKSDNLFKIEVRTLGKSFKVYTAMYRPVPEILRVPECKNDLVVDLVMPSDDMVNKILDNLANEDSGYPEAEVAFFRKLEPARPALLEYGTFTELNGAHVSVLGRIDPVNFTDLIEDYKFIKDLEKQKQENPKIFSRRLSRILED